jgi:hypothetical protein
MMTVKFLDGGVKFLPFFPFHQELGNLCTSFEILWSDLPNFTLLRTFSLRMQRTESVLGELALMLIESGLGLGVPDLALSVGKVLPS